MATDFFSFDVAGTKFTLDLTFAGSATSGAIESISGDVGTDPITQLDTNFGEDNIFSTSFPFVDNNGIGFDTKSGGQFHVELNPVNPFEILISGSGGSDPGYLDLFVNDILFVENTAPGSMYVVAPAGGSATQPNGDHYAVLDGSGPGNATLNAANGVGAALVGGHGDTLNGAQPSQ